MPRFDTQVFARASLPICGAGIVDQRNFLGNHNPKRAVAPAVQQLPWRNLTLCRFITTKKKVREKNSSRAFHRQNVRASMPTSQ